MIENSGRMSGKSRKRPITAFYIETLILVAVFTFVILVLTRVFAWSGQLGRKAELLTGGVHLAENAAEAVAVSDSLEEVLALLEENGNAEILERPAAEEGGSFLRVWYDEDLNPSPEGDIWVDVTWNPAEGEGIDADGKGLVESRITVCRTGETEPVYTLDTAVYVQGE